MSDMDYYDDLEIEDSKVIDYIREVTDENEAINSLTDDDLQYLLDLWYDYLVELDEDLDEDDDTDVEVDTESLYQYILEALEEDEADFTIQLDDLLEVFDAEQEYVESLLDDEEED